MCGRFVLVSDLSAIAADFGVSSVTVDFSPNRNVHPGQEIPVIVSRNHENVLEVCRWGLIPFWAKDPAVGAKMINARAETVAQKPSFKYAFAKRRCLIPADGFYEWKKAGDQKIPYLFFLKSRRPFVFAGLYESWTPGDQKPINTCTIITTRANRLVASVHERMPVIVPTEESHKWLRADGDDPSSRLEMLKPYPDEKMQCVRADLL
jgi:putative SOS response-associated peptidase YedK